MNKFLYYASHPKQALGAAVRKAVTLTLDDVTGWDVLTGGPTYTGKPVSDITALQITASWSAIRLISETIGTLPLHLYRRTDKGREKARDHKLYDLLHLQPNPHMTSLEWREAMAVSLCVWGQSYNLAPRLNRSGRIVAITPVAKPQVRPELTEDGQLRYHVTDRGKETTYTRGDIVPIKGFGGAGELEGYPPYKMGRQALAIAAAAEEYGARFFSNGGRPAGFFTYDKILKPEQRQKLREVLDRLYGGLENMHKIGLLEAGITFSPSGLNNADAQLAETRKAQVAEIARIWRVPLNMLMEMDRATYNNTEQENLHFLNYTLSPYLQRIEQALNTTLLTREERRRGYYIEFDVRGLLRGDSKARGEYYRNMRMVGGMTINEIRARENLPRIEEGGDDVMVPLNMAPPDLMREILGGDQGNNSN